MVTSKVKSKLEGAPEQDGRAGWSLLTGRKGSQRGEAGASAKARSQRLTFVLSTMRSNYKLLKGFI